MTTLRHINKGDERSGSPKSLNNTTDEKMDEMRGSQTFSPLGWVVQFDQQLTSTLSVCADDGSKLKLFRPVMKALEISCHGIPWIFGVLTMILVVEKREPLVKIVNFFLALLVDLLIVGFLKTTARRQRPHKNQDDMYFTVSVDNYSFPSGHATRALFVAEFLTQQTNMSPLTCTFIVTWAYAVALSRVMLGRHHVTDVVIGVAIGYLHYHALMPYYWLSQESCLWLLKPLKGDI